MANQVVKVRRETIASCMTCPLCNKLLRDATTISECLHTFCRKCIYKKLSDEEFECCPICNIDLGCVPLEKLRPDHNLQDMRAKIFPLKRRKVEAPEIAPSITLPARRKERSLSSLVVSTPKVLAQTTTTGRRTKPVLRKASSLRGPSFFNEKPIKKEETPEKDRPDGSSSPETVKRCNQNAMQNSSSAEHGKSSPNDEAENGAEAWDGKSDLWQPLNCLVEVANRTKSFKCNSQASDVKLDTHVLDNDPHMRKAKFKEKKDEFKLEDEKNNTSVAPLSATEPKKLRRIRRKKAAAYGDSGISSQAVLDAAVAKQERRMGPVWFSLVASADQEGEAALPQIPASYLRIKDGNIPVSCIQNYLVKKLDLCSEDEVEIKCMGRAVVPTLLVYNLVDLWLQTTSKSDRVPTSVGSSARDFVMVLAYSRKVSDS